MQPSKQPHQQTPVPASRVMHRGQLPRGPAAGRLGRLQGLSRSLVRLREQAPQAGQLLALPTSWSALGPWLALYRERCARVAVRFSFVHVL